MISYSLTIRTPVGTAVSDSTHRINSHLYSANGGPGWRHPWLTEVVCVTTVDAGRIILDQCCLPCHILSHVPPHSQHAQGGGGAVFLLGQEFK